MKRKPKRPARKRRCESCVKLKREVADLKTIRTNMCQHYAELRENFDKAEADKRILQDELLTSKQERETETQLRLTVENELESWKETAKEHADEADELEAERDALAKRNEELEAESYAYKTNRTKSMMTVEKWT